MHTAPALAPEPTRRRQANQRIHALTCNRYFDSIPVMELQAILADSGFNPDPLNGIYCGHEGRISDDARVGDRTWCNLSWYRMPSGRYEITCYLS